jgi:hypothetical protein
MVYQQELLEQCTVKIVTDNREDENAMLSVWFPLKAKP